MSTASDLVDSRAADRLVSAAHELLTEGQAAEITVRAIAARAGVQHSLIARHFGSRDALLANVVANVLARVGADAQAAPDLAGALDTIIEELSERPRLTRSIGSLVSQGIVPSRSHHPIVQALEHHLEAHLVPAARRREVAVALIVAIFGWSLADAWWLQILGHTDDPISGRQVLYRSIDAILAGARRPW